MRCIHQWVVTGDGHLKCPYCGEINKHLDNVREVIWPKRWMTKDQIIEMFGEEVLNPSPIGKLTK